MYTGTLIDDLMAVVERAEKHTHKHLDATLVEQWQALPAYELTAADLLGVA
jgi:hypothetical protein